MNTSANTLAAADVCAKCKKACQEVLASCAAWHQGKTPPLLRESPPRASKTTALACIASQLHRPPPEERPGYVPVASVMEESGHLVIVVALSALRHWLLVMHRRLQPIDSTIL
jgi:hypothetical protein